MLEDIAIMIAQFALSVALIPTITGKHKPPRLTSLICFVALMLMAVCFLNIGLILSAMGAGLCATLWLVLLIQVMIIIGRK